VTGGGVGEPVLGSIGFIEKSFDKVSDKGLRQFSDIRVRDLLERKLNPHLVRE